MYLYSSQDDLASGGIPSHPTTKLTTQHHNKRGKSGNPSTRLSLPPIDDPDYRPRFIYNYNSLLIPLFIKCSCTLHSTAPGDHDNPEIFLTSAREQAFTRGVAARSTYSHPTRPYHGHNTIGGGGAHADAHHAHRQGGFFRKITSKFSRK